MSHNVLTSNEISLLSKGLNFCQSQHFDLFEFICNFTIRRHYYVPTGDSDDGPDTSQQTWPRRVPIFILLGTLLALVYKRFILVIGPIFSMCNHAQLKWTFQNCVEHDLASLAMDSTASIASGNKLNVQERSALRNLQSDTSIVIHKSNNGALVVVMDAST